MTTLEARFPSEAARPVRGRLGFDLGPCQFLASLKRDLLTKVATEPYLGNQRLKPIGFATLALRFSEHMLF
jgi:hypothetical protein